MTSSNTARLIFSHDSTTREIPLSRLPLTIGRLVDRDLVLPYPYVSRNHAEVVHEGRSFFLVDQGSQAGTFVNGERVGRRLLTDGDVIQIGSVHGPEMRFRNEETTKSASLRTMLGQMNVPYASSTAESELGRLGWFVEAARRLNNVGAVNEILAALVETTLQLTQVERGYVFLRDSSGELRLALGRNNRNEPLQDDSTVSHRALHQAIESGSGYIVTDTLSAAELPSESMVVQNLRTILCIPLRKPMSGRQASAADILGVLYLDSRQQRANLTTIDSDLLNTVANEAAALVENATLAQAEEAGRRYREELRIASEIQQGLMLVRIPELKWARVRAQSLPCKGIGGDFYDVIATEEALYVVVADISGKGVSAALLGSTLQGMVHAQVLSGQPLEQIAKFANRYICGKQVGKYATMVLLRVTAEGYAEYINCGHVRPLLKRGETVKTLPEGNLPVGLMEGATYETSRLRLNAGDRILIVTDGVTEAESREGDPFGEHRLEVAIGQGASLEAILEQVREFTSDEPLEDDCTLLEVCFAG